YNCTRHRRFSYRARGIYIKQIRNWLSFFPREQILVISSDDLRKDANGVTNKVFAFLGLPPHQIEVQNPDKHTDYEPMKSRTRKNLVEFYRPYNAELEELLGMKFNWN